MRDAHRAWSLLNGFDVLRRIEMIMKVDDRWHSCSVLWLLAVSYCDGPRKNTRVGQEEASPIPWRYQSERRKSGCRQWQPRLEGRWPEAAGSRMQVIWECSGRVDAG